MLVMHTAYAKDEHRQHDAHEHGVAKLSLVQEGSSIQILFETPAANIVEFEHEPKNAKEKQKVENAVKLLKQGSKLFSFSTAAQCVLKDADVEGELAEDLHHDEHEKHHDEHAKDHDDHEKHHDEHGEEAHSEFEATYKFQCEQVAALTELSINIFKHFPNTEEIDSQIVTEKKQFAVELTAKNATIRF